MRYDLWSYCLFQALEWYGLKLDIGLFSSMYNSALVLANSTIEMASSSTSFQILTPLVEVGSSPS